MGLSRYTILLLVIGGIAIALHFMGFYKIVKRICRDCIIDHKTGKVTINNLARFLTLISFLFLFISVHFELHIKPNFKIITVPFSEWELAIILAFIIGAEAVKKYNNPPTNI